MVFGCAIYPLDFLLTLISNAFEVCVSRELDYSIADLFKKANFGMVAIYTMRQIVHKQKIREAKRQL